jgi:eukaryotic-like serine/threonine-protein kinase
MADDTASNNAKAFSQLAIENGLAKESDMDRVLALHAKGMSDGGKSAAIEDLVVKEGVMTAPQAKAISKAAARLSRDAEKIQTTRIGNYEIISKIGDGGLGTVYRARQLSMHRVVALKVLHKKWLSDQEFKSRFLLEARLAGKLSHQNLIQVYDVQRVGDLQYFSMEYVDGETVEDIIERDGPMPLDRTIDIVIQILRALAYIQKYDIVHRDVKPGNIMLTKAGVAKLGDFGFVKYKFDSVLSQEGEVLGTPDYISPEQAMGDENVDWRSDVYSLGATMYHMLSGRPPFEGSVSEVMRKHIKAQPRPLREVVPDLPDEVIRLVERMMAKKPEDRCQAHQELFEDLELLKATVRADESQVHAGRSTIMRALDIEKTRLDRMRGDAQKLNMDVLRWKNLAMAGFAAAGIMLILALIFALLFFLSHK